MKYRLLEIIQCPEHPTQMLHVVNAQLSEVFPYSGELAVPYCRYGCGILCNWFEEIPADFPSAHRFNCRRCIGTEIESADIVCPEDGVILKVEDGVLKPVELEPVQEGMENVSILNSRNVGLINRLIDLKPGEMLLTYGPFSVPVLEQWNINGIERVHVELLAEKLLTCRAASCADCRGFAHYIEGPIDPGIFKPGQFDAIVMSMPPVLLAHPDAAISLIPGLLRPSGRLLLLIHQPASRMRTNERLKHHVENLPAAFSEFKPTLFSSSGMDLVLFQPADEKRQITLGYGHHPAANVK